MKKYCKILNEETGLVQLGAGCSDEYYKEIGMKLRNVDQSDIDNLWYLFDKCPHKSEEQKEQEEKERIHSLSMTRSDFFDNTIKAWGTDDEELLPIIKGILETLGVSDLEKKIAINNYNNALNFYRKHTLFTLLSGIPIPVGDITVNVSSEKWDSFFDKVDKRDPEAYKELLPS